MVDHGRNYGGTEANGASEPGHRKRLWSMPSGPYAVSVDFGMVNFRKSPTTSAVWRASSAKAQKDLGLGPCPTIGFGCSNS